MKKLDNAHIAYNLNTTFDVNELLAKGYDEVPLLEVEAKLLKFTEAVNWINKQVKGTS